MSTVAGDALDTVLDIRPSDAPGVWRVRNLPQPDGRVFGGQILAQALLAAAADVEPERTAHAMHASFLRQGVVGEPVELHVDPLLDGRSFSVRRVEARQRGVPIFTSVASFQRSERGFEHMDPPPPADDPATLPDVGQAWGDADDYARFWGEGNLFDVRHVAGSVYRSTPPDRSAEQRLWFRCRATAPADRTLHRALLAFALDQVMLHPVLRRHGLHLSLPGIRVASLDHTTWWHDDVDVADWLLCTVRAPVARNGRGLGLATVHDRAGRLVATAAQEGLVRMPVHR